MNYFIKQYDKGLSFIGEQAFEINAVVEVSILPETISALVSHFLIVIARCYAIENGRFDIGARIQMPEE